MKCTNPDCPHNGIKFSTIDPNWVGYEGCPACSPRKKNPVVKSTAATTAFCAEKIEGSDGRYLWIDGNGKITAGNGTLKDPRPNAFSLIQIADCPYRTSLCERACYVHGLEKHAPETHALYVHNSKTIREILREPIPAIWALQMANWIVDNCPSGFRWHVSGDIFSHQYAWWIGRVCYFSPDVHHWIYTRSVAHLDPLKDIENLTVNLSADAENYAVMRRAARDYGFRLCYLTTDGAIPRDMERSDVIFPDYLLRGKKPIPHLDPVGIAFKWWDGLDIYHQRMVCPVDMFGKSEALRCGPCNKCLT